MKLLTLIVGIPFGICSYLLNFIGRLVKKDDNLWVFGAWFGQKYGDNPKYLFEHVSKIEGQRAVWITQSKDVHNLLTKKGYEVHYFYSLKGMWLSMRARYLLLCVAFQDLSYVCYLFSRKSVIINLWHGTPLKQLVLKRTFLQRFTRELLIKHIGRECDYVCTASNEVTTKLQKYFNIPDTNYLLTGYPRNDGLFKKSPALEYVLKHKADGAKVIMYMPTFREPTDQGERINIFQEYGLDIESLSDMLEKNNAYLLFKLHYRDASLLETVAENIKSNRIIVVQDSDIEGDVYSLLGAADILITDYSSVYFDYLLLDRPIVFACFDKDKYMTSDRGFYYDYEEVTPGAKVSDWKQLEAELKNLLNGEDRFTTQREKVNKVFNHYRDGNSSRRVHAAINDLNDPNNKAIKIAPVKPNLVAKLKIFFKIGTRKEFLCIGLLALFAVLTHLEWFNLHSTLFFHDWKYRPDEVSQSYLNFNGASWLSFTGLGGQNIQLYAAGYTLLWGLVGAYQLAVKISLLWPIAFLSFLAPYFLVKHLVKDRGIALLGALYYGLNTYLILRSTAHMPIALVNALAPLIILSFIRLLERPILSRILQFCLLFSIGCYYELRIMYVVSIVLMLYIFIAKSALGIIAKNWKKMFCALGFILALNIFWIVPTAMGGSSAIDSVANRGLWGDQFYSVARSLALSEWKWTGGEITQTFDMNPIPLYFWVIPIISLSVLARLKSKKGAKDFRLILFFAAVLIIGVFLSKQSDAPLPEAYNFLYNHVPGFNLFREGSKFYLLVAFGYLGLFAFSLKSIFTLDGKRFVKYGVVVLSLAALSFSAKPLLLNQIGGMFTDRQIPQYYSSLKEKLTSDDNFSRTLWVPINSQLGYFDLNHPKISFWEELGSNKVWQGSTNMPIGLANFKNPGLYTGAINNPYGEHLLDSMSVKYAIVPPNLDINVEKVFPYAGARNEYVASMDQVAGLTKEPDSNFAIYSNSDARPYIDINTGLFYVGQNEDMVGIYGLMKSLGLQNMAFTYAIDSQMPTVQSILSTPKFSGGIANGISQTINISSGNAKIYKDVSNVNVTYQASNGTLHVLTSPLPNPTVNGQPVVFANDGSSSILQTTDISDGANYYISTDSKIIKVNPESGSIIGQASSFKNMATFKGSAVNLPDPSFENVSPNKTPLDCHNYDDNSDIKLALDTINKTDGRQSLELAAVRHDACYNVAFDVDPGEYYFGFDYQNPQGTAAAYSLVFNDNTKTKISGVLTPSSASRWNHLSRKVAIPSGATKVSLFLYSRAPKDLSLNTKNVARYDAMVFDKLSLISSVASPAQKNNYVTANLSGASGKVGVSYPAYSSTGVNLIANPSFEAGPWNRKVADCHNYDGKRNISMWIDDEQATDGFKALVLDAARHDACASTAINLDETGSFLFSFDAKGNGYRRGGYHISFNDSGKTVIAKKFDLETSGNWRNYSAQIKVPSGATQAVLHVYAYESNGKAHDTVYYDNFQLVKVPDLSTTFYISSGSLSLPTEQPKQVSFAINGATKKTIHITKATKPFYLLMSETYDKNWLLQFADTAKPAGKHLKANEWQNAWYIEPDKLCATDYNGCINNGDGSYDMDLIASYKPQKYFYYGFAVSGVAFVGSLIYLTVKRFTGLGNVGRK